MTRNTHRFRNGIIFFLIVALTVPILRFGYKRYACAVYPIRYEPLVTACADEFDLPPSLLYAIMYAEGHFDEKATSAAGAKGLMQLTESTFYWVKRSLKDAGEDIYDPQTNIRCAGFLLGFLRNRFSEEKTMLAAYNAGSGNVSRWLENAAYSKDGKTLDTIPIGETRLYVKKVTSAQKMYQTLYELE